MPPMVMLAADEPKLKLDLTVEEDGMIVVIRENLWLSFCVEACEMNTCTCHEELMAPFLCGEWS